MSSPFKLLDAYTADDTAVFFGRDTEIEQLYALILRAPLLLVYGRSGTGKTSLVQCGLAARFKPTDRFEILVRREEDLNAALARELQRVAVSGGGTPIADGTSPADALYSIYLDRLRPIQLIFDQFEELLLLGTRREQDEFFAAIAELLQRNLRGTVVFVLREEFIAMLDPFESVLPALFSNRCRVEPMTRSRLEEVLMGTVAAAGVSLEHGRQTARRMLDTLGPDVQLAYLQVYLDKLYRLATKPPASPHEPVVFTDAVVETTGAIADVLADFLDEQVAAVQEALAPGRPGAVQRVLEEFATLGGTKQTLLPADVKARLEAAGQVDLVPFVDRCLLALEARRVLRRIHHETFELAHDSLARRVADSRSADEKMRMRAERMITDRLGDPPGAADRLLIAEELDFIKPFAGRLVLTANERRYYDRSVAARHARQRARMRRLVATAAVIVVALFAGLAYVAFKNNQVAAEQLRAATEQARAVQQEGVALQQRTRADQAMTEVGAAIGDLFRIEGALQPLSGSGEARRQLRDRTHWLIDRLNLKALEEKNNPTTRFWTLMSDGDRERRSGRVIPARKAYEAARAIAAPQAAAGDATWQRNLALTRIGLGDLAMGTDLVREWGMVPAGVWGVANMAYGEALNILDPLAAANPHDFQVRHDQFAVQIALGGISDRLGNRSGAQTFYQAALTIAEALAAEDRADWRPDLQASVARAQDLVLARRLIAHAIQPAKPPTGWITAAEAEPVRQRYAEALRLALKLQKISPADSAVADELWQLYRSIGELEFNAGRPKAAIAAYTSAVAQNELLAAVSQRNFATVDDNLGVVYLLDHDPDTARKLFDNERQVLERRASLWPDSVDTQVGLFTAYFNLGSSWYESKMPDEARTAWLKSRDYAVKLMAAGLGRDKLDQIEAALQRVGVAPLRVQQP